MSQVQWWLPLLHLFLFTFAVAPSLAGSRPLLDGPGGVAMCLLFFADLPLSLFGFSMMWDGRGYQGLSLWAFGGSVMWYVWGSLVRRLWRHARVRTASRDQVDRS